MATIPLDLDGYTDLPPGLIANVVTYLQLNDRKAGRVAPLPPGLTVRLLETPDLAAYRDLYRRIGEAWLWFSRAVMSDAELLAQLGRPGAEILFLERDGEPLGLAELQHSEDVHSLEVAMFGVVASESGTGAARGLMSDVLDRAFGGGAERVWLHTCHFDHPAALPFYQRMGFRPWKFAIEVSRDPRLDGFLPREAGPHVPLIDPAEAGSGPE
ncbi:Protein N-acetyltransferase, RimJ/RimL family [Kaistia soli DSM 19436]|uniref:Protein N-acetyltransferase, RimJ/RimL family n=1 Tax=Kaistia soli DSM 19436 TaxID=1122133 RepID=A0A1M5MHU7_9HYPH|nr:GNAT family N-acetyltransferase [Kaistia soli]SHG76994.1 Protein N-acetyltransferase, RimJ/RimL family [Kaistia soli DSM 19436]